MFNRQRPVPSVSGLLAVILLAGSATAHSRATVQSPAPSPSRVPLVVVDSGQGFAIRPANDGAPCASIPLAAAARLSLGANLKLDRSIFRNAAQNRSESPDAQSR